MQDTGAAGVVQAFDDRMFRRLAELAPDAMIAHRKGRIEWANEAAALHMGVESAAKMVGLPVLDFVAPESRPLVVERIQRMLASGANEPLMQETFLRQDGVRVRVEVAASPVGDGLVLVVVRDISGRVEAERDRRAAEARARAFFETTSEAMGISRQGVHVEVNAAYAHLFGYGAPADLVGVPIFRLIDPRDHARIREQVARRARGEPAPASFEITGVRRDGSSFDVDVRASSFQDGEVPTTVVVMRDVTARHAWEQRLAESERRYRELVQQVPVGVWEYDLSGVRAVLEGLKARGVTELEQHLGSHPLDAQACLQALEVVSVNATTLQQTGARDREHLAANLGAVFLPEALPSFIHALAQLAGGQPHAATEGWNGTLAGERRWVAVQLAVAEGHAADWKRVLVTTSDLTAQFHARQETEALQERLRHGEKLEAVGRLAGGVAHDFNNLLAAIMANAELAQAEPGLSPDLQEGLATIMEASHRARDLVKQILTFGRKDRPQPEALDFPAVVQDALSLVRSAIPTTVALDVALDATTGTVQADRTQVHQIVLNLCSNARDAVNGRGHIQVQVSRCAVDGGFPELRPGPHARLRVRDDGVGMDEATRARIFEPYLTTKARGGGHGLGLAVVHGIVAGAGGAIRVESAPGQGATFDVYFPLVEAPRPVAVERAPAPRGGEHVLLVDDEPLVRSAHRRLLKSLGYRVTEAADGEAALALFRAAPATFDLVLSDQSMPRMSGAELARALKAEAPLARVVLCTGYSDVLTDEVAQSLGLKGLLAKPVDKDALARVVREALA